MAARDPIIERRVAQRQQDPAWQPEPEGIAGNWRSFSPFHKEFSEPFVQSREGYEFKEPKTLGDRLMQTFGDPIVGAAKSIWHMDPSKLDDQYLQPTVVGIQPQQQNRIHEVEQFDRMSPEQQETYVQQKQLDRLLEQEQGVVATGAPAGAPQPRTPIEVPTGRVDPSEASGGLAGQVTPQIRAAMEAKMARVQGGSGEEWSPQERVYGKLIAEENATPRQEAAQRERTDMAQWAGKLERQHGRFVNQERGINGALDMGRGGSQDQMHNEYRQALQAAMPGVLPEDVRDEMRMKYAKQFGSDRLQSLLSSEKLDDQTKMNALRESMPDSMFEGFEQNVPTNRDLTRDRYRDALGAGVGARDAFTPVRHQASGLRTNLTGALQGARAGVDRPGTNSLTKIGRDAMAEETYGTKLEAKGKGVVEVPLSASESMLQRGIGSRNAIKEFNRSQDQLSRRASGERTAGIRADAKRSTALRSEQAKKENMVLGSRLRVWEKQKESMNPDSQKQGEMYLKRMGELQKRLEATSTTPEEESEARTSYKIYAELFDALTIPQQGGI